MTTGAVLPRCQKEADGTFRLRDLPPLMAGALRQLPSLLDADAAGIRDRLRGSPYPGDAEGTGQWDRHAAPELAHLFLAARTLVEEDLRSLLPEKKPRGRFQVEIPAAHLNAWLSSLSAARVGLAGEHGFEEEDLEAVLPDEILTERDRALLVLHLLGWVQGLLLEG